MEEIPHQLQYKQNVEAKALPKFGVNTESLHTVKTLRTITNTELSVHLQFHVTHTHAVRSSITTSCMFTAKKYQSLGKVH